MSQTLRIRIAAALLVASTTALGLTACSLPDTPTTGTSDKPAASKPAASKPAAKKSDDGPKITKAQANAVAKAKMYLETMPFSEKGLIDQLKFDKFSTADATYGAKHCGADWNEQAVKKAKQYVETMPMSEGELVDQLKFDGFTDAQAKHGAKEALKD